MVYKKKAYQLLTSLYEKTYTLAHVCEKDGNYYNSIHHLLKLKNYFDCLNDYDREWSQKKLLTQPLKGYLKYVYEGLYREEQ